MPKKHSLAPRKKPETRDRLTITLDPSVLALVDERADNRSEQIGGDLLRYYRILAEIRPTLRERFSPAELSLILDACNGWAMDFQSPEWIWLEVADSVRLNHLDTKWEVSEPETLIQRLRALTWLESVALADAVARWWHAVGDGDHTRDTAHALD